MIYQVLIASSAVTHVLSRGALDVPMYADYSNLVVPQQVQNQFIRKLPFQMASPNSFAVASTPKPTEAGKCQDADDLAFWGKGGCRSYQDDLGKCGRSHINNKPAIEKCMQGNYAYGNGCAGCMGEMAICTGEHCMFKCLFGNSPSCKQCVDDHCTPAFNECSGFSGSSDNMKCPATEAPKSVYAVVAATPAPTPACQNTADLALWADDGCKDFQEELGDCGRENINNQKGVEKCMKDNHDYSQKCLNCMGKMAICAGEKCMFKCLFGNSDGCKTCMDSNCTEDFNKCSGFTGNSHDMKCPTHKPTSAPTESADSENEEQQVLIMRLLRSMFA